MTRFDSRTATLCFLTSFVVVCSGGCAKRDAPHAEKLYWFIPDGMRADPEIFNVFQWAQAGELPHLKKLMERGSYGYCKPVFPSHTPTNFATLLTGTYPDTHGVNDGPMRVVGKPLDRVAIGGFSSVAKKVPPIWTTLEQTGHTVSLLAVPGSTPPELNNGYTFRGRWGGWGADFHALVFESRGDTHSSRAQGKSARLFFFGPHLTRVVDQRLAEGWGDLPASYSPPLEAALEGWGSTVHAVVTDSTDDGRHSYDLASFSLDKQRLFASLRQGQSSAWEPVTLQWKVGDAFTPIRTELFVSVIKLDPDGLFRIRVFYNNLNPSNTSPSEAASRLLARTGPMVDFVDNFPPQLISYQEDKRAFLDEMDASFAWHRRAVKPLMTDFQSDVVIHDIYSPNQMLTSRWWMGYVDPTSARYHAISEDERRTLWREVKEMYKRLDDIIGEILSYADPNTYVVVSSDHGAVPLDRWVHLNNVFAHRGWLKFTINPATGEPIVDWENSQVVYLQMAHVYINPRGLIGNYERATGSEYESLRQQVVEALQQLRDENGMQPVIDIVKWEDAQRSLRLSPDRTGDLVIANAPGYGWTEDITADLRIFSDPLESGYKQAIHSEDVPGMWTPFLIAGPGIRRHHFLGEQPVEMVDQYPTIMKALGQAIPDDVQGKLLDVFE